jgi:diphthine synthase
VGLGLNPKGISLKGIQRLEEADSVFVEFYTNPKMDLSVLEERADAEIRELDREEVERRMTPVAAAEEGEVVFLVPGDPFAATTHRELVREAKTRGVDTSVCHAGTVFGAVGETGFDVYRFGRTVTLPSHGCPPSVAEMIQDNDSVGLHTMVLFDPGLGVSRAADMLRDEIGDRECVVCCRLGTDASHVETGVLSDVTDVGDEPSSIVLTGDLTEKEEEYIG